MILGIEDNLIVTLDDINTRVERSVERRKNVDEDRKQKEENKEEADLQKVVMQKFQTASLTPFNKLSSLPHHLDRS